jgi:hypothetical protein
MSEDGKTPGGSSTPPATPPGAPPSGTSAAPPTSPAAKAAKAKLDAKRGAAKKGVSAAVRGNLAAISSQIEGPRGLLMEFFDACDELNAAIGKFKKNYDWREIFLGSEGLSKVRLMKMQLLLGEQKKIPKKDFDKLAAKEGELETVKPGETDGAYMYRVYGMLPP